MNIYVSYLFCYSMMFIFVN